MKKLTLFILLCWPLLFAGSICNVVVGQVAAAAGGCTSETADVTQDSADSNAYLGATNAKGQSFSVTTNGKLSSIDLYIATVYAAGDVILRWGTSSDLSTYSEEVTVTIAAGDANAWKKFTFTTKADVTTGTTYYFGLIKVGAADPTLRYYNAGDAYASHNSYQTSTGWALGGGASTDFRFRVNLCDE